MKRSVLFRMFRSASLSLLGFLTCLSLGVSAAHGGTRFGIQPRGLGVPASLDFDDLWFYDDQMIKVLPRIDLQWVAAVLESPMRDAGGTPDRDVDERSLREWAEAVAADHSDVNDYFCDQNLVRDACFFRLRSGIDRPAVAGLIQALNRAPSVSYAHPAITMKGRTYAFFNALHLEWKSGVPSEVQDRIMKQAHLLVDEHDGALKVNIFRIPFFRALRWLAEDIRVLTATPYLVELKRSIEAKLILPISGSHVGDQVPFTLQVTFSDAVTIDPSSIATFDVRLAGIPKDLLEVQIDPYDHVAKAATSPIEITGRLRVFISGEFFILPVRVNYTCLVCSDRAVRAIETEKTAFRVASLLPREPTGARLIVPAQILAPDLRMDAYRTKAQRNLALSLSSFLMAGLLLGLFVRRVRAGAEAANGEGPRAREDLMAQNLEAFLQQEPAEPHWRYLGETSNRLREYLVLRLDLQHDPLGGTARLFFESVQGALPATEASKLESFLQRIDDIVAREVAKEPDIDAFRLRAMEILTEMKRTSPASD